jgi:hypothetical protein
VPQAGKNKLIAALQKEHILAAHIGDLLDGDEKGSKRVFVVQ